MTEADLRILINAKAVVHAAFTALVLVSWSRSLALRGRSLFALARLLKRRFSVDGIALIRWLAAMTWLSLSARSNAVRKVQGRLLRHVQPVLASGSV